MSNQQVTKILQQIDGGDPGASRELLPLVYDELRKLAAARLRKEKPGQTLQATALVHDAYLRLVGNPNSLQWNGRGHFFAAAAEAMRRILIENARSKLGPKRGGGRQRINLPDVKDKTAPPGLDLIALSEALDRLALKDSRAAEVVKLRFFAGLSRQEVAETLGTSLATIDNDWAYAKGWLKSELDEELH